LFAHTRHPDWDTIRHHLDAHQMWREMVGYSHVRREWRQEAESWLWVDWDVASVMRDEAQRGLWGAFAPQFASLV
jgi:PAS domain-containing protein